MLQYSSVQKRLYCRHFSINIYFLLSAIIIFSLAFTPLGDVKAERAINGTLDNTIKYFGLLLFVLGFRGVTSGFVSMHKLAAVLLGMFPTMFLGLLCIAGGILTLFSVFLAVASMSFDPLKDSANMDFIVSWFLFYTWTCAVWYFILRIIFKHYSKFERAMDEGRFSMVCILLFFLGLFGAHRFYVGRPVTGALFMATFGFCGIGVLVDAVLLYLRRFKDNEGMPV